MYLSLVLYGSRARGDHRMRSDVDLLGIVAEGNIQEANSARGVNLHEYPKDYLIQQSKSGNLFLLHLVSEGISLSDDNNIFSNVVQQFQFKNSYEEEKKEASAVIWFCLFYFPNKNVSRVRKRLVWAIRTLIIATAAEQKKAVFSSQMIQDFSGVFGSKNIIDNRNTVEFITLSNLAEIYVKKFGYSAEELGVSEQGFVETDLLKFGKMAGSTPAFLTKKSSQQFWNEFYS